MADTNSTLSGMLGGNTPQSGGISGLLSNPLFLQYLSGAGAALSSDQPVGAALGNITMQNIAAQSQAKLLSKMLSGMPAGAKLTADRDNLNLKLPSSALAGESSMMDTGAASKGVAMQPTSTPEASQNKFLGGLLNPSASPLGNISPADLAGLTPSDITQAVGLSQTIKQREAAGEVARMNAATSAYKALTTDKRTSLIKNYEYAKSPAGGNYQGSIDEFQRDVDTGRWHEYQRAVGQGYEGKFEDWIKEMAALTGNKESKVTWTTATRELTKRFGKLDPTGMWAVTPELQSAHNKAQELLVEYKREGVEPLEAINRANVESRKWANTVEKNYNRYIEQANKITDKARRDKELERVKNTFFDNYGYIPR